MRSPALISATERRAMAAERETVDRLIAALSRRAHRRYVRRRASPASTKAGLFVQLPNFGADGFIPVSSLDGDYYIYDETARALFGERTGKGYQLADRVEVRLVEVAPLAGTMRFEMLSEPKAAAGRETLVPQGEGAASRKRRSAAAARATGDADERPGFRRRASLRPAGARAVDGDDARLSRPLPALRQGQTVSRPS